jgi:hypothetical protein
MLLCLYSTASPRESNLYLNIKNQTISADIKNTPLKDIIEEIKHEKGIWFKTEFMRDKSLLNKIISLRLGNVSVKEGLDRILRGINHSLFFKGNRVVGVMLFGKPGQRYSRGRSASRRSRVTRRRSF